MPKGFQPGRAKTGGIQKGGKHNSSLVKRTLSQTLSDHGFDPIAHLLSLMPQLKPEKQADVILQLAPYLYARQKEIGDSDGGQQITLNVSGVDKMALLQAAQVSKVEEPRVLVGGEEEDE